MTEDVHGVPVLICDADGEEIGAGSVMDLIGSALGCGAHWVLIPAGRLDPGFFELRSGVAGEIAQKFVNYQIGIAIAGDISSHIAASTALGDFARETNRGRALWFVAGPAEFRERLAAIA